ncbi:MAG: dihydroxyacetone kinase subunit DhaL [Oscillospiraceae bacterium]
MDKFLNGNGKPILEKMVRSIQENKAYLGDIDGLIGDGDHGMNMNKGFTMFWDQFGTQELSFTEGIGELGTVLFSQIGGSMGPIYGTIFMEMSDAGEGCTEIGLLELIGMLEHGMNGLLEIVDARVGDKTLVDTLNPALDALKQAQTDGKNFYDALDDMKAAAVSGRDSTMDLVAQYGRAARLGERSKGVLDAGAASCCLLLNAMADGIQALL